MNDSTPRYGTEMPIPYLVEFKERMDSLQLVRTKAGGFHVFKNGQTSPLLVGADFILTKDPLTSFIQRECPGAATFHPAKVGQLVTKETWEGYTEIVPIGSLSVDESGRRIDLASFDASLLSKSWIWKMNDSSLFVSPYLKSEIQKCEWSKQYRFFPGLSRFAG